MTQTTEIGRPSGLCQEVSGQLLTDMFLTMAVNLQEQGLRGELLNQGYVENLGRQFPEKPDGWGSFREWGLRLHVQSLSHGSIIMRHGSNPYLENIEAGSPTAEGIVTSINVSCASFCLDPGEGPQDKDREVTVMPFDLRTLHQRVFINVVSVG